MHAQGNRCKPDDAPGFRRRRCMAVHLRAHGLGTVSIGGRSERESMARLAQLTPGASVRGLMANAAAKVVQVEWFGDQAVKVTFEQPDGTVRNRLVYRSDEASLELVGAGRA